MRDLGTICRSRRSVHRFIDMMYVGLGVAVAAVAASPKQERATMAAPDKASPTSPDGMLVTGSELRLHADEEASPRAQETVRILIVFVGDVGDPAVEGEAIGHVVVGRQIDGRVARGLQTGDRKVAVAVDPRS